MTIATEDLMVWLFQGDLVVGEVDMVIMKNVFLHLLPVERCLINTAQRLTEELQNVVVAGII